ncbi:MAG: PIN domain-containing protein, partial [Candidatus Lokiarchaeota archaeon]|nr:PIN domain-containing protein [Candidatus Lokiarchaeota archaeon]
MIKQICLDTGIITLLYSNDKPSQITTLFNQIKKDELKAHVVSPIIAEAFFQICKLRGKIDAEITIATFLNTYPIKLINLNQSLIIKAGLLKCQHYNELSYNDCFAIAYALNKKLTFHTTEKNLGKIFP